MLRFEAFRFEIALVRWTCRHSQFITDPLVVVEAFRRPRIDVDRDDKLRFNKAQPTLRHIVLVYQDQMRIEHYRRTDEGGRWKF